MGKETNTTTEAWWTVVGAGPAGIITVGILLDYGVIPKKIFWIDPEFQVGRLGKYYQNVPGNTEVKYFRQFLEACHSFKSCNLGESIKSLYDIDPTQHCILKDMVRPLKKLSEQLQNKVSYAVGNMTHLIKTVDKKWLISIGESYSVKTKNVVLATGCRPKTLDYTSGNTISLDDALDNEKLKTLVNNNDTVAVFGSSHSAILVLKALYENGVHKIINFYKDPLKYAQKQNGWTLYHYTGLKTVAANWAKEVLENNKPKNIIRVKSDDENIEKLLAKCTKAIYAIGYERNPLPPLQGNTLYNYNKRTGIIAPGLYGIGFAFPSSQVDPCGNREDQIGLRSFYHRAKKMFVKTMFI